MNITRRGFLKSLGVIGIVVSTPVAIEGVIEKIGLVDVAKRFDFDPNQRLIFRRMLDKRWILEYVSDELFNPDYKDNLVIQMQDTTYLLKGITDIQISTEYAWGYWKEGAKQADYIHFFTGNEWKEV